MIAISIKDLLQVVGGQCVAVNNDDKIITDITIDSRKMSSGALFIALMGEKFDGHEFVKQAVTEGASVALVSHQIDDKTPQIIVQDTHLALGQIATWVREHSTAKVVALTGSSGKTSVKEMTAAILSQCGQTLFTKGNLNNDIGVPLTLFQLTEQDEFAVIELGANHIGEIAYTTQMVKPHSALINNIAQAHLEGFGSLDGVAKAKSEIFLGLPMQGIAIVNLDSYRQNWLDDLNDKKIYSFALQNTDADFYAQNIVQSAGTEFILHTPIGKVVIHLPLLGLHNVANAVASAALAISVGANLEQIKTGLQSVKAVKGRLFPIPLNDDQLILDDSYNANIGSMTAAIDVLAGQRGYKILVVGDMAELGNDSVYLHQQIGEKAHNANLDCVISVGENSALISQFSGVGHHFQDKSQASIFLRQILQMQPIATVLVKGSRSSKMEEVIHNINHCQG
ncbi:UDP-N-acetylmuramoyl-tripeptide--D-alanyl-D-alanine ligase [Orbus hercynius]|uniref:UDP-N-acetylmuramoyl-tripeptide--D-alanyl-D-alanine ligase n=1 Tax=Orbus hercynius TaxID=593135 RepID=A0A495RI02_9GAMM|nr:UDP-N-acetylmuramoyl-tripeptide--D-alanyl-D-alanine ligase [Orbus hercynius]RKS86940.1 UDP-N-acetylmuramoyl-tripeptide--D-alanyl-D-alanine ligase [Orbus hercynius]